MPMFHQLSHGHIVVVVPADLMEGFHRGVVPRTAPVLVCEGSCNTYITEGCPKYMHI